AGALAAPRVTITPVAQDAVALWSAYVEDLGGEGIVLKDPAAPYRPGERTDAWLKVKRRLTLEVLVHDGAPELVRWGDWGWAARLRLTYPHPTTRIATTIEELVRVPHPDTFTVRQDALAHVLCWGVLPSGRLRHPVFLGWQTEA